MKEGCAACEANEHAKSHAAAVVVTLWSITSGGLDLDKVVAGLCEDHKEHLKQLARNAADA